MHKDEPVQQSYEKVRTVIRDFICNEIDKIVTLRGDYSTDDLRERIGVLNQQLLEAGEGPASAPQHVEDSLRYLAFFLADNARHSEAMSVGILLNDFRARYKWKQGHRIAASIKKLQGLVHGYFFRPSRVALCAIGVWILFAFLFKIISMIAPEPAILIAGHLQPKVMVISTAEQLVSEPRLYHYLYFSGVTLTTLGYGDMRPNTKYWWGIFPAFLAVAEAFAGYFFLGLFIAVFASRSLIHPYARVSQWFSDFETEVLSTDSDSRYRPRFYTWDWKRYK